MSGHSKWNNIKRKKEKTDGAKAKVFTKIGREISVAVRDGGPNPASNSKLADLKAELFNLRFQHAINQLENPGRIDAVKKDIARVMTVLAEKQ